MWGSVSYPTVSYSDSGDVLVKDPLCFTNLDICLAALLCLADCQWCL